MNIKGALAALILFGGTLANSPTVLAANGETIFGITSGNTLVRFNSETPAVMDFQLPISGLPTGEVAVGIDFRPINNTLYLISNNDRLYTVNPDSGVVSAVGGNSDFTGTNVGIDVNPVADSLRLVSNADENARINLDSAALISSDSALAYDSTDINAGQSPNLIDIAYSSNSSASTVTTLFGIDSLTNSLVRQGSPNGVPLSSNTGTLFTIGSLGVDASENVGFDIAEARDGKALASIIVNGQTSASLYAVDLGGGQAFLIGEIGSTSPVVDIAIQQAGAVRFDQSTYTVTEGSGTLNLLVERIGGSHNSVVSGASAPSTVIVNTKAFSATAGNDFTSLTNSLVSFAEGEVSKTVKITIPNDNIKEFPENFTVSLSSPTGGLILADSGTASVTIVDDDSPSGTVTPGAGAPELTLTANSRINKSRFIRTGFPFTVECNENCTVRATVTVTQGIARRYGLSSTILATNISRLTADNDKQLNATPRSSIARRLQSRRGSIPATLTVTARGTNGSGSDVETKRFNIADDIVRRNN